MELGLTEADTFDPNPDIHALFCHYNSLYFEDALGACILTWSSKRMTLCAGVCLYLAGGGCEIRLSEPLLKFRPSSDLKNTLLHEMIHAYLWIKKKNKDHSDHGPCFQTLMKKINSSTMVDHQRPDGGYHITIYHSFHDEVDNYRVHHWMCQSCGDLIKRAINREPSINDCIIKSRRDAFCGNSSCHWHVHRMSCGGNYKKIAEPPGYKDKRKGSKSKLDFHESKSVVSTHTTRKEARKAPKEIKTKDESHTHMSNTIESFFPIISEVNTNLCGTSPGQHIQFDESNDFHESKSKVPIYIRKSSWEAQNEVRTKDESDALKLNTIDRFFPIINEATRNLDDVSSSGYDLQNNFDLDELMVVDEVMGDDVKPEQVADFHGSYSLRKKQKSVHSSDNEVTEHVNYTVAVKSKDFYMNEGDNEADREPLDNKRTERRTKQKLLKNPEGVILKVESMGHVFHVRNNTTDIEMIKSVEDDTSSPQANSNSSNYLCPNDHYTCENIDRSAASKGLEDVLKDHRNIGLVDVDRDDVIDLSDG